MSNTHIVWIQKFFVKWVAKSERRHEMRIFLAGATGAIGKPLLPMLISAGHTVIATTQHKDKMISIHSAGAIPMLVDALNKEQALAAVREARPEIVIHQLTAIPANLNLRHFDEGFALTNRLRTEATDYLLAAARAVGARRFIAQSYAGWYARTGNWIKTEDDPLISSGITDGRKTLEATVHVEEAVLKEEALEGFVLRYGSFYGPGTSLAPGAWFFEGVRQRRVPIVGDGSAYWFFLHTEDAASATLAAVNAGMPGIYNITDDEPARVSVWLPYLAEMLGAKPPRHVPKWLARLAVGEYGVAAMTELRGSSNRKAKSLLSWKPKWPSWRQGFKDGFEMRTRPIRNGSTSAIA
jgi:2-alkyl-3-oxoalkanoate reductase